MTSHIEPRQQERAKPQLRRRRRVAVGVAVLAAIVVAVVVGSVVQASRQPASTAYHGPFAPVTLNVNNTVTMAQPGVTKPVLNVYEDFQCPICQAFETANGGVVQQLAYQGKVKVIYHPFTIFLGTQPRQANSTRAWAAAKSVPASLWVKYHNLLFANQPSETAENGFPVTELLALGRSIGLTSAAFTQDVTSQKYAAQIVPLSEQLNRSGINATPTVTLDGQPVLLATLLTNGTLSQAILAAH